MVVIGVDIGLGVYALDIYPAIDFMYPRVGGGLSAIPSWYIIIFFFFFLVNIFLVACLSFCISLGLRNLLKPFGT